MADQAELKRLPGQSLTRSMVEALTTRGGLLVLDNCEHVIEGAAELVEALLAEAGPVDGPRTGPGPVRVLATSREGLGLATEQLPGRRPPWRPTGRRWSCSTSGPPRSTTTTTRRPAGTPWSRSAADSTGCPWPSSWPRPGSEPCPRPTWSTGSTTASASSPVAAAARWSATGPCGPPSSGPHDLLTGPEQVLFRRLSIFAGSFDLASVEQVAATPDQVDRGLDPNLEHDLDRDGIGNLLDDLVERSMVLVTSGRSGRRFRLLETMRQFGAEQLAELDHPDELARRHAHHVADEVAHIGTLLSGWDELDGVGRLQELWPNLQAAFDWAEAAGDVDLARRLIWPIGTEVTARRGVGELVDWTERLMTLADPGDDETIAQGLLWSAFHYSMTSDHPLFDRLVERFGCPDHPIAVAAQAAMASDSPTLPDVAATTIAELERRGDHHLARIFEVFRAATLLGAGRLDEAEAHIGPMVERFGADGPPTFLNWALYMQAAAADLGGDPAGPRPCTTGPWPSSCHPSPTPPTTSSGPGPCSGGASAARPSPCSGTTPATCWRCGT